MFSTQHNETKGEVSVHTEKSMGIFSTLLKKKDNDDPGNLAQCVPESLLIFEDG